MDTFVVWYLVVVPSSSCGWHPYDKKNKFQTMGQNHTYYPLNKNNKKPLYDFKYMYKCINIYHQIIYPLDFQQNKYLPKQQQPNHLLTHVPPQKKHLRPEKSTSKATVWKDATREVSTSQRNSMPRASPRVILDLKHFTEKQLLLMEQILQQFPRDPITEPQMISKGCIITSSERYLGSITFLRRRR